MNPVRTENAKQFATLATIDASGKQSKNGRNRQAVFTQRNAVSNANVNNANMNRSRQQFQLKTVNPVVTKE